MARRDENTFFVCVHCGQDVAPVSNGSYRNHCPHCLWSLHVDVLPGDRASGCHGPMAPVGLTRPRGKDVAIVHVCRVCGQRGVNKLARDTEMPDDLDAVLELPPA